MASAYPPPPNDPPPRDDYNPEALEDIERGTFRNVDIDQPPASVTASYKRAPSVTGQAQAVPLPINPSESNNGSLVKFQSPFGYMNYKDQIAMLGVFSLVVLIQSALNCSKNSATNPYPCTEINGFAVAAGTVSLVLCIGYFLSGTKTTEDDKFRFGFSVIMFLWWTASMIALTFFGPFKTVQYVNGYFGTWGAFFTATMMLAHTSEIFRKSINKFTKSVSHRPVMYLFIASLVEIGAGIDTCVPQSECFNLNAFAIALGSVSAIICLVMMPLMDKMGDRLVRNIAIFFCLWWVIGGMIVTFDSPFQTLGNGYFSVFAAIISSFYLLQVVELDRNV